MDYSDKNSTGVKKATRVAGENQQAKVRYIERQFEVSFPKWLYDLALTLSEPIKAYSWFMQSLKYKVEFDEESRIMNFIGYGHSGNYPQWAIGCIKEMLGKEIYEHFGKLTFAIDGLVQK